MQNIRKRLPGRMLLAGLLGITLLSACNTETPASNPVATPTTVQARNSAPATVTAGATSPALSSQADRKTPASRPTTPEAPTADTGADSGQAGQTVADDGFRSFPNGYSFPNWGSKKQNGKWPTDLTLSDLLKLFGDADVCVKVENGVCTPRQDALSWLSAANGAAAGGHCEGMAVSSLAMFKGIENPADYDKNAKTAYELKQTNKVKNLITYYFIIQNFDPVKSDYDSTQKQKPSEVLDAIIASMKDGAPDPVNLGFFNMNPYENAGDPKIAGHSITPISVENRGGGVYWVHIYDNNHPYPNEHDDYIQIDRNNETWSYDLAAATPEQPALAWQGDASTKSLGIVPLSARTGTVVCPWCDKSAEQTGSDNVTGLAFKGLAPGLNFMAVEPGGARARANAVSASNAGPVLQVSSQGDGTLVIKNSKGQRLGFDGAKAVNEIPGATFTLIRYGPGVTAKPIYYVPAGDAYDLNIDGSSLATGTPGEASVSIFGRGMAIRAENIEVNKGEQQRILLSSDAQTLSFIAGSNTNKPTFNVAATFKPGVAGSTTASSYDFQLGNFNMVKGQQVDLALNASAGHLNIKTSGAAAQAATYDLTINKSTGNGSQTFQQNNLDLLATDGQSINFNTSNGIQSPSVEIDHGNNGSVDLTELIPPAPPATPTVQP